MTKKKISLVFLAIFLILAILLPTTSCNGCKHEYSAWETVKKATCEEAGEEKALCDKCGEEAIKIIDPFGEHKYSDWETVIEAAYAKRGLNQKTCSVCSMTQTESIPALCETTNVKESSTLSEINLSDCKIVYGNLEDDSLVLDRANKLAAAIKDKTGAEPKKDGSASFEIVIGETDHTESTEARKAIEGSGFIVRVVGNKVVIVGSDDFETTNGIQYFINKYLATKTEATISVATEATLYNTSVYTVADKSGFKYDLVFDKNLDNDTSHAYTTSVGDYHLDHPARLCKNLSGELPAVLKTNGSIVYRTNETTTDYEILIGPIDNADAKSFLASLDGNEYGILVKDKYLHHHAFPSLLLLVSYTSWQPPPALSVLPRQRMSASLPAPPQPNTLPNPVP